MRVGVLTWLYLVVLWLTWTPVGDGPPEVLWRPPGSWIPFFGNLLLFAPFGFVLAVDGAGRARPRGEVPVAELVARVATAAAILSVAAELGQFGVPGRTPSPWDVALNCGGAGLAAWLGSRLVRSGLGARRLIATAMGLVFTGVLLFVIATGFTASRMLVLAEWNEEYPVVAGNEPTGGRFYDGRVADARICALPDGEACAAPGATLEERLTLSRIAQDTQAVRLSAVVTSSGPQAGDARIVTFSMDARHRNATLYQEGRDLVLRLRTPLGGPNGTGLEFVLPEAIPDAVPMPVGGSFRAGRIEMTAGEGGSRAVFLIGPFSGWWLVKSPGDRLDAGTLRRAMLVSAAAFSLPLGLGAVLLAWGSVLVRLLGSLMAAPVLVFLLSSVLSIPVSAWEVAAAAALGVLGGGLGLVGVPPPSEADPGMGPRDRLQVAKE